MDSKKNSEPLPRRWECVVEAGQRWVDPEGTPHQIAAVVQENADAAVWLRPIPTAETRASHLCAGDSGWSRLPDEAEDQEPTTVFRRPHFETTIVGMPCLPGEAEDQEPTTVFQIPRPRRGAA